MTKMEKTLGIMDVMIKLSLRNGCIRQTVIAGLLLAGSATAALAADPVAGEKIFKMQCGICHATAAGENRIGPTLFGVVGRPAGSVAGFNYTADHKKLGITWDTANLDKYLTNPRAMVADTSMVYAGLKDDNERADLVAYLGTLH
jgi:cytochrome c